VEVEDNCYWLDCSSSVARMHTIHVQYKFLCVNRLSLSFGQVCTLILLRCSSMKSSTLWWMRFSSVLVSTMDRRQLKVKFTREQTIDHPTDSSAQLTARLLLLWRCFIQIVLTIYMLLLLNYTQKMRNKNFFVIYRFKLVQNIAAVLATVQRFHLASPPVYLENY